MEKQRNKEKSMQKYKKRKRKLWPNPLAGMRKMQLKINIVVDLNQYDKKKQIQLFL